VQGRIDYHLFCSAYYFPAGQIGPGWFACTKVLPPGPIPGLDPSFSRSMCAHVLTTISEYITSRGFLSMYVRYDHGGLSRLNLAA
jgi:hypothetical protein